MNNKVLTIKEAVNKIPDSKARLALGGFAITRCPIAFVNEIIRQKKEKLDLYQIIGSMDSDLLVGSGCVKKYSYSGGSLDRFGRIERINQAIANNEIEVREYSGLSMSLRFLAGSYSMPFVPSKTLLGTDILNNLLKKGEKDVVVSKSPFSDEKWVYLKALQPDYAIIHAQYADQKGNVIIEGPKWDMEMAKAAKNLFVTVEKIVSNEYIKNNVEKVTIPALYTTGVIEAPYGAFPTSVYNFYDYGSDALKEYAKINRNDQDFEKYKNENILGTDNHYQYLNKICDIEGLLNRQAIPDYGYQPQRGSK
ncbi:MAG: hypothetical protein K9K32_06035 [Halanaerobiales bacterium]|nr:hypothetical protein [Halanaerobiales bacterium]